MKNTVRIVLIGVAIVLFLSSGISNYFQDKWFKDLKVERDRLEQMNNNLANTIKTLEKQYTISQERITTLENTSDSLKERYALKQEEMDLKEQEYQKEIEEIKNIPADTVYKKLMVYYPPGDGLLKYPFSSSQIRSFYFTYSELDFTKGLVLDLGEQNNILKFDLITKEDIISQKDFQLSSLRSMQIVNEEYMTNLKLHNTNLERSYKSERRWKHVWQGVSLVEFGYIIFKR